MIKRISIIVVSGFIIIAILAYSALWASLPSLEGQLTAPVDSITQLQRDSLGTAVINAKNINDAAYALGYAHGQDRLFQMDLLRRSGAGEIAELFGEAALNVDKRARFHQFRKRAQTIFSTLPAKQQMLLQRYSDGVNEAVKTYTLLPFEYLFLQAKFKPWLPEDSLLTSFSMYLDLQHSQVMRDFTLTRIGEKYGQSMLDFLLMPSSYQAALDGSIVEPILNIDIPQLSPDDNPDWAYNNIPEPIDFGSNNWAVSGAVTKTGSAMLSDDMHLGLRVPPIWYRASLNYQDKQQDVTVTGVSLPGSPAIIVGSNGKVAWGFTNANLDNTDWIELAEQTPTEILTEVIMVKDVEHEFQIEMSEYGPVRRLPDSRYALRWVAHQPYAINLNIADMATVSNVTEAQHLAHTLGIPVQNMVIADDQGNISWTPAGAVTARPTPSNVAITENSVSPLWGQQEPALPDYTNPDNHRIWTANSRVISTEQLERFGDGGYALGSRGLQIRDRLFEIEEFEESDFYTVQLDNEAQFLGVWHNILTTALKNSPNEFSDDLTILDDWQSCACPDSAGYSLVRRYRTAVINQLLSPLENHLKTEYLTLRPIMRSVEPAIQEILRQQPLEWLPAKSESWNQFLMQSYRKTRKDMLASHVSGDAEPTVENLQKLRWGTVNALKVQHPFSRFMPILSSVLDMPTVDGFGDSYMPAVQNGSHGASQRLIVQPGRDESAILTVPGGQSGHPLSNFYRIGFNEYVSNQSTPLLPGPATHTITLNPQ